MRREERPVPGGTPIVVLIPECESERRLTAVESSALDAAVTNDSRIDRAVKPGLMTGNVESREFNGYGAYIRIRTLPGVVLPEMRGLGLVELHVGWKSAPLRLIFFSDDKGDVTLEFYPVNGENWLAGEVERVLSGEPGRVEVRVPNAPGLR